ncbi:polyketide cyclase [Marispirochaeta aestuarii]|uniref:Polyketide cyclase n=1 Tax=Marispirochaeta aestuarii TaxID=1963862 RepID=A0A1Y1RV77_9SPIO|nr:SRPBCC domain-containing protein [Marispirochaeta aestuarii]ORC32994.1 polyketide cyclase [Marispirochaeta aestuarii]
MKELSTEVTIKADAEKVWKVFSDFANYPSWNPFIRSVSGNVQAGQKITVVLHQPGMNPMTIKPEVMTFKPNRELRWIGHLFFKGLFDGEHSFELIQNDDGTTTFLQKEIFRGILVPLFRKMLDHNTRNGFELMNGRLKEYVERA